MNIPQKYPLSRFIPQMNALPISSTQIQHKHKKGGYCVFGMRHSATFICRMRHWGPPITHPHKRKILSPVDELVHVLEHRRRDFRSQDLSLSLSFQPHGLVVKDFLSSHLQSQVLLPTHVCLRVESENMVTISKNNVNFRRRNNINEWCLFFVLWIHDSTWFTWTHV